MLIFDVLTKTSSVYTKEDFNRHLDGLNEIIDKGVLFGELAQDKMSYAVNGINVSHYVSNMFTTPEGAYVDIQLLNTAAGDIAKKLEGQLAVRPRMMGTVSKHGIVTIDKVLSFDLILKGNDTFPEQPSNNVIIHESL